MSRKTFLRVVPLLLLLLASPLARAETKTIARCGEGFLEEVDGYEGAARQGDAL